MRLSALNSPVATKLARFLLVGGGCTLLQYLLLVAFVRGLGWSATPASTLGYGVSSGVNYFLSHRFTFKSTTRHRRALPRFALILGVGMALNGVVTYLGVRVYGLHYLIAQTAATSLTLVWNFLANLLWTF